MSAGAVWLGRAVTVLGLPALLALPSSWLLLGAGPLRTTAEWTALAVLAGCALALTGHALRVGRVRQARAYELALMSVARPADPGARATIPAALRGSSWPWARVTAATLAVPTALVLFGTLGAGVPDRAPTAGRIADAHHVIRELPVVAVHHVEHAGSSPHSTSEADYTVRLPVPGGGRGVAATFRTEVQRGVRDVGETLVVAYAPEHPDVGAVGATTTSAVEAQLAGRPLAHGDALIVGIMWALTAVVAVGSATAVTGPPRRSRRVDARWGALRAVATGVAEHVERPSHDDSGAEAGADSGADSGAKKSPPRYACLILRTETGEVPLRLTATHKSAGPLLTGAEGWLLWDPAGSRGKVPADFVADDGWQLPGRIPRDKAARLAPAPPHEPLPLDAARRPHLLELGSQWTRTVPLGALFGLLLSLAAAGALLLPVDGGWRTWTAAAGVLAPLVARLLSERSTTPPAEKDTSPIAPDASAAEATPPT